MDQRILENITDYQNESVKKLSPMKFKVKATGKTEIGLIAQQVQLIEPAAVMNSSTGSLTIDYEQISVLLLSYIKQLEARIDNLEIKLAKKNAK